MGRSRIRKEKSDTHVISNIRTRCLSVRKDKLTTLHTKRHALYHSVCGVGLTVSGGYQIILRSFLTGSITLTCGLTFIMLVFVNLTLSGLRIVFIRLFLELTCLSITRSVLSQCSSSRLEISLSLQSDLEKLQSGSVEKSQKSS